MSSSDRIVLFSFTSKLSFEALFVVPPFRASWLKLLLCCGFAALPRGPKDGAQADVAPAHQESRHAGIRVQCEPSWDWLQRALAGGWAAAPADPPRGSIHNTAAPSARCSRRNQQMAVVDVAWRDKATPLILSSTPAVHGEAAGSGNARQRALHDNEFNVLKAFPKKSRETTNTFILNACCC